MADSARQRIWIISEDLCGPPDEGVKNFAHALAASLRRLHDVELVSTHGPNNLIDVRVIPTSRTYLSRSLRSALRASQPKIIVYATRRSATFFSFMRAQLLKFYCPDARVVLLGLQTRKHARWQQALVRRMRPDLVLVQSNENHDYLAKLGCRVAIVPSGVDVETFRPVDETQRIALRMRYGLSVNRPVILHVGHLQEGRGIRSLIPLAATGLCQVLLVTSSSTRREASLEAELRAAGVKMMTDYVPHIEELYQLADCYVFPVNTTDNAIEVPLSVLEALACDLPVVTTRFGGLPRLFGMLNHPGLVFVDMTAELAANAIRLAEARYRGTRVFALPFSWTHVSEVVRAEILAVSSATR